MIRLSQLNPINLLEEKEKFFQDNSYNPQFMYAEPISEGELTHYGLPQKDIIDNAELVVKEAYFGRNQKDLLMMEGPIISRDEVTQKIRNFLALHKLERRFNIVWSSSFVSRTTITQDTIKLRSNAEFRKESLIGMLYHEIGTHALRRINYEEQPWFKKKNKFGFKNYLRTEEGLAILHSLLAHTYKSSVAAALRYLSVDYAATHSFVELWDYLLPYVDNPEARWLLTFREKRGLADTSQPGGYTKDLVYFEGAHQVAVWLDKHNYDCTTLYFGKLDIADVEKAVEMNPDFQPLLPSFFVTDTEKYAKNLHEIAIFNHFLE